MPWIPWSGGVCPLPPQTPIYIRCRDGYEGGPMPAGRAYWEHHDIHYDLIGYRLAEGPRHD